MRLVDAVVKRTNADVTDAANVLQDILAAAANERGEWELPLSEENTAAMRQALEARSQHLNEVIDMRRDSEALLFTTGTLSCLEVKDRQDCLLPVHMDRLLC